MHLCLCVQLCEDAVRSAVMSEAADEALELDCDHATPTIKEIVCGVAPTPPYVKYHDTYLRRYVATGTLPAGCLVCHVRILHFWCAVVPSGVFITLHVTAHSSSSTPCAHKGLKQRTQTPTVIDVRCLVTMQAAPGGQRSSARHHGQAQQARGSA
jgi:hypothetical protein